jgi:hypothetical protein
MAAGESAEAGELLILLQLCSKGIFVIRSEFEMQEVPSPFSPPRK